MKKIFNEMTAMAKYNISRNIMWQSAEMTLIVSAKCNGWLKALAWHAIFSPQLNAAIQWLSKLFCNNQLKAQWLRKQSQIQLWLS